MAVLVVDDNATNRRILAEVLTRWGMKARVVGSAAEALEHLRQSANAGRPYPLVITDAQMPAMNGFDLIEQMKTDPNLAFAAILMLTSAGQRVSRAVPGAWSVRLSREAHSAGGIRSALGASWPPSRRSRNRPSLSPDTPFEKAGVGCEFSWPTILTIKPLP